MPVGALGLDEDDRPARTAIIGDVDPHRFVERHGLVADAEQPAIGGIEAVGDVGKQQRLVVLQQRGENEGEHFVRTVADKHLIRRQPVIGRQGRAQRGRLIVGIEPQRVGRRGADRLQHARRRAERVLVGVELDEIGDARLFARRIRA